MKVRGPNTPDVREDRHRSGLTVHSPRAQNRPEPSGYMSPGSNWAPSGYEDRGGYSSPRWADRGLQENYGGGFQEDFHQPPLNQQRGPTEWPGQGFQGQVSELSNFSNVAMPSSTRRAYPVSTYCSLQESHLCH